jgi:hypothetical protein
VLGQAKINENLTKKIGTTDKILENINTKLEGLSATVQTQLSFNEHLEKQIAQLAAAIPVPDSEKTPRKPKVQFESVNLVSTVKAKCRIQKRHGYVVDSPFIAKKGDPGRLTITIGIGPHVINNAYCDLGASVNIMSKVTFDEVLGGPLDPADFRMQMADQSSRKPVGIVRDILVRLQDQYIPTDFVIIDMGPNKEVPLLLGRPFLFTTNVELHMGTGFARFRIQDKTLMCPFNGYKMFNQPKSKRTRKKEAQPYFAGATGAMLHDSDQIWSESIGHSRG